MSSLDKHEDHYKQAPLALQGRLVEYSWVVHDNVWELFQWLNWFGKDLVQLSCSMMGVRSPVGIQVYGAKDSKYDLDRIGFILDLFLKPFQIMIILNSTKFIWRKDGIEKRTIFKHCLGHVSVLFCIIQGYWLLTKDEASETEYSISLVIFLTLMLTNSFKPFAFFAKMISYHLI